jgi:hypothetical protein
MKRTRMTHNGRPYQYKMNNKKRDIVEREGLESDEEEVEDFWDVEQIEEILCAKYERKTRGLGLGTEGKTPVQIIVSVEPTTPCVINTPKGRQAFKQPVFSRISATSQGTNSGKSTGGTCLGSSSQISTPRRSSSSTNFKMARVDPTIRLP